MSVGACRYAFVCGAMVAGAENRWIVTNEGTRLQTGQRLLRLMLTAAPRAEDGMEMSQSFIFDAASEAGLRSEQEMAKALCQRLFLAGAGWRGPGPD